MQVAQLCGGFRYVVEGSGEFPKVMLPCDCATFASDANAEIEGQGYVDARRRVALISSGRVGSLAKSPESVGWRVAADTHASGKVSEARRAAADEGMPPFLCSFALADGVVVEQRFDGVADMVVCGERIAMTEVEAVRPAEALAGDIPPMWPRGVRP